MAATRHNTGKPRLGLIPFTALVGIAKALEFGAKKYAAWNWTKGMSYMETADAVLRHLTKWLDPSESDTDDESGLNHLFHAGAGIVFLIFYVMLPSRYGKYDDRGKEETLPYPSPPAAPMPHAAPVPPELLGQAPIPPEYAWLVGSARAYGKKTGNAYRIVGTPYYSVQRGGWVVMTTILGSSTGSEIMCELLCEKYNWGGDASCSNS